MKQPGIRVKRGLITDVWAAIEWVQKNIKEKGKHDGND